MKRISYFTAPLICSSMLVVGTGVANAADTTTQGLYSGVGAGNTIVHDADIGGFGDNNSDTRVTDNNDTAQSAFVGYKFNNWFSTEANFTDFGDIEFGGDANSGEYSTKAYSLSAIGEIPVYAGLIGYARVGAAYWKANGNGNFSDGTSVSNEYGTDPVYGLGVKYQFKQLPVFARAEYTRYDMDSDYRLDVTSASVGVQF
ncbi:porin family protein [Phytohalomonas tamaricis]|uniref:outer membrane beta-barrel protein n=1 Tax=Phytohalomonas tamaricis TaxID=2081032 RepID=UPI000D0B3214|nr:outer membrane beta-barrel protein [Phytohalomonas tamaricis]